MGRVVTQWNHFGLYACMLLMPFSGYIASNFSKHGKKFFNVKMLPPWGIDDHRIYTVFNTTHVIKSYRLAGDEFAISVLLDAVQRLYEPA